MGRVKCVYDSIARMRYALSLRDVINRNEEANAKGEGHHSLSLERKLLLRNYPDRSLSITLLGSIADEKVVMVRNVHSQMIWHCAIAICGHTLTPFFS